MRCWAIPFLIVQAADEVVDEVRWEVINNVFKTKEIIKLGGITKGRYNE